MLKRVIIAVFASLVLVTPMAVSAVGNESTGDMKSSLSVENGTVNKEFLAHVIGNNINEAKSVPSQSQAVDKSEPILPTGWLLTLALLGFVMLSNRSGV